MTSYWRLIGLCGSLVGIFVLVGCGATSQAGMATRSTTITSVATPTTPPTPTPLPTLALHWQAQKVPAEGIVTAFAATDANTFYACSPPNGALTTDALASHDGGAHILHVTVPAINHGGACTPVVDEANPNIAILKIS